MTPPSANAPRHPARAFIATPSPLLAVMLMSVAGCFHDFGPVIKVPQRPVVPEDVAAKVRPKMEAAANRWDPESSWKVRTVYQVGDWRPKRHARTGQLVGRVTEMDGLARGGGRCGLLHYEVTEDHGAYEAFAIHAATEGSTQTQPYHPVSCAEVPP